MEKEKAATDHVISSFNKKLDFNRSLSAVNCAPPLPSSRLSGEKTKPQSLVSLCLGVLGKHLDDVVADLAEIATGFPSHLKMAISAIARRRKLLNDEVLISLADSSWEILDISGSEVTDSGLIRIAEICKFLRALDISQCNNITAAGVSVVLQNCRSLQTLRCGGCPKSDYTARNCLCLLKLELKHVDGDSWEELDVAEISHGAESLRWLVWPKVNPESLNFLVTECPRIIVNPKPSPFEYRGMEVPIEAFPDIALDHPFVKDIDPKTWAVRGFAPRPVASSLSNPNELSMAEKFRLAFLERDTRLAPKRAKNARQHQRRAERDWMTTSTERKAIALASRATKSLRCKSRNL
ncbi:hypothetical protein K2173_003091 [Erythroxylum novogranatense]|uniref:RNI-like superfamily protein n=1 Tax=Erythroxylum novogranatense TaxID=1862640 RepID=A0AAV8TCA3_9ROSI|nr:hypothetical protein K2173_003091 [Erythroxylum novogranatense]